MHKFYVVPFWFSWDFLPACSILVGYVHKFYVVHFLFVWGFVLACSIPSVYVHEFYILICSTISWMKDPLGMLENTLRSIIPLRSVLVMILTYHEVLMVYGPLGTPWRCVAHWGTFLHRGIIIFFFHITHWGLMLTPPSRGLYQLHWGNFILQLSRGLLLCLRPMRESVYDTGFTWDLVNDLDSLRSVHDDFWSTEGCFFILSIHWGYFWGFQSTRDIFWCFRSIGDSF